MKFAMEKKRFSRHFGTFFKYMVLIFLNLKYVSQVSDKTGASEEEVGL